MQKVVLDGRLMENREVFHETIAAALDFPGWYGKNLDALYDCLTDLEEDTQLRILCPEAMKERLGRYGERIIAVLLEAREENGCLTVCLHEGEEEDGDAEALGE